MEDRRFLPERPLRRNRDNFTCRIREDVRQNIEGVGPNHMRC